MRLLLDTNVVIALEDVSSPVTAIAADLARLAQKHSVVLMIHEASRDDFERDSVEERRFASVAKAGKYPAIDQPPAPDEAFLARAGKISDDNDRVDTDLLYAIERDCADALVTEDRRLHKRANRLGLGARTYYVEQAVDLLTALFEPRSMLPPTVEDVPLHSLHLDDPLFDTLRGAYTGESDFDAWFKRKSREGRWAWVIRTNDKLDAICIYNLEEPETSRSFKLCTFKVSENSRGRHLGELLLKTAFATCDKSGCSNAFVEIFPEQDFLIDFLGEFGFVEDGLKPGSTTERVYRKRFRPPPPPSGSALEYHIAWAPAFDSGPDVGKFFVPVQPQFHSNLFPEAPTVPPDPSQLALDVTSAYTSSVVGNGIRKAYLSNSPTTKLRAGDLLLFYRSHDTHAITTLAVVEDTLRSTDASAIGAFVGKRTVYDFKEIEAKAAKSALAILFRQVIHLPKPLPLTEWQRHGGSAYQSITEVSDDQFARVMEWGNADPS